MAKKPKLPANSVYEKGLNCGNVDGMAVEVNGDAWDGIEWEQPLDTTAVNAATTTAATQFHYANTSNLILCGKIIKQELSNINTDLTKLGVCLAANKADQADIWGRYLERTGGGASISSPMMSYYRHLFSETDAVSLLVLMETLGGPVAHTLYNTLQHTGDPLFQQITENLETQKQKEIACTINYLQPSVRSLSSEQKQNILATAKQYNTVTEAILQTFETQLTDLDIDPRKLTEDIQKHTQQFYADIGLLN